MFVKLLGGRVFNTDRIAYTYQTEGWCYVYYSGREEDYTTLTIEEYDALMSVLPIMDMSKGE